MEDKFMKKVLIATLVSLMVTSTAMAADTYVGSFLEKQEAKLNNAASPLVNKEKQLQAQQNAVLGLKQQQETERQNQLVAQKKALAERQAAQQALVNKKKQDIQTTKDSFKKDAQDLKNIFTIN